jgi:RNA polymerase sigma-70 factor (ECF subfamily)
MNTEGIASMNRGASMPMSETQQRRALDDLRTLDAQAISAVFSQYFPEIHRYVYYRTGDLAAAEDLASDVFVRLLEAVKRKRGPETNLKGWLLATASHVVVDYLRRRYRRPVETISEAFADHTPGPALLFDQREENRSLREAYARLTPDQQEVLALRFGQGCSLEDTAAQMKKKVNAVKALQFRALAALQRHIAEVRNE